MSSKLPATGRVVFGATVELEDQDEGAAVTYQIVGEDEADIRAGRISIDLADRARADRQVRGRRGRCGRARAIPAATRSSRSSTSSAQRLALMARRSKSSDRWLREHISRPLRPTRAGRGCALARGFQARGIDQRERPVAAWHGWCSIWRRPRRLEPVRRRRVGRPGGWWPAISWPWSRSPGSSSCRAICAKRRCCEALQAALGELGWTCCCPTWRRI